MSLAPALGLLLLAQSNSAPEKDARAELDEQMSNAAAQVDCNFINSVWRKANRMRDGASSGFQAALDNLHARRKQLGCLKGCDEGSDCPPVKSFAVRFAEYRVIHKKLTGCLEGGPCEDKTIDDLQAALRTSARVLLGEIQPKDALWTELVSGFSTIVGFDTSAGSLLAMIAHLTSKQRQGLDSKELSRAVGALLDVLPPNQMEAEDVIRLFEFATTVLGSDQGAAGTKALDKLRGEWSVLLGILDKTRSPAMRAAIDRMLDVLVNRHAHGDPAKAGKYRNLQTDLAANASVDSVAKVVRGLDIAELEEFQRGAERMVLFPAILAEYRAKRLYTTVDLPAVCPEQNRVKSEYCDPVYALADQFRLVLDGRALAGTTKSAPMDLDGWLVSLDKDLTGDDNAPKLFVGQFAGGIGLRVRPVATGSTTMNIRAAFIVETMDNDPAERKEVRFDRGEEPRTVDLARELDVGKHLAEAVLARSTLLKAFDRTYYPMPPTVVAIPPPTIVGLPPKPPLPAPSPLWALVSAGAPLVLDGTKKNDWAGIGLSAADTLALASAGLFFIQAKHQRDAFSSNATTSLSSANDNYGYALDMLVTSGVLKVAGLVCGWIFAEGRSP
jgi:hypothetical protein